MERRPPWWRAPPDLLSGPWLLALLLFSWTLRLTGGQSANQTGAPILVSLANKAISFDCRITYPDSPQFRDFTTWYFHVDLQKRESLKEPMKCSPNLAKENQTHTLQCRVTLTLPNASATGTYYCSVDWQDLKIISQGVFILVRDAGYRAPAQDSPLLLLSSLTGLLTALSVLVTALLLWEKKRRQTPQKQPAQKDSDPGARSQQQPLDESVYTALQCGDTEVYSCIQNEASRLPPTQSLLSQEKPQRFTDDSEFNMVYENL
ncbi:LOW QUALITY PROTEIN: NFAT activation molecule 1 [Lutra lutra]|uniref:LOW QUALITY PROTEIN: NFAT activation molecule 1 n=1 Tax=Lutra lutra TaxID=9657 RepID=UPI001FD2E9C2|nr:LOW QUALITY PROTEIN: NFAT activation molecule 1 [Lutra lutra]